MDAPSPVTLTTEELRSFHKMDRDLFRVLVINLCRDPMQSMQLIALWLWLEEMGFPNMVNILLSLNYIAVNSIAEEGMKCLACILSQIPPPPPPPFEEIPLTRKLMTPKQISLEFLFLNRNYALHRMTSIIKDELFRTFEDIAQQASSMKNGTGPAFHPYPFQSETGSSSSSSSSPSSSNRPMNTMVNLWSTPNVVESQVQNPVEVPPEVEDRTLLVTFSRGNQVAESEVRSYFVGLYGNCIEKVQMQEVPTPNTQKLYALVVFRSKFTVQSFLGGNDKVEFSIGDRLVFGRPYLPKQSD